MKTAKYFIEFVSHEYDMCNRIEISKKEYNRQLAFLNSQIENTKNDEETPVENRYNKTIEHSAAIETINGFSCGCSDTYLIKFECKEGYAFVNKK